MTLVNRIFDIKHADVLKTLEEESEDGTAQMD